MRISHVIKTDQWRSDVQIRSAAHFVMSQAQIQVHWSSNRTTEQRLYLFICLLFILNLFLTEHPPDTEQTVCFLKTSNVTHLYPCPSPKKKLTRSSSAAT